jgi:hypothetical protein
VECFADSIVSARILKVRRARRYAQFTAGLSALGFVLLPHASWACKCAQRPLGEYYAEAHEVVIARLIAAESDVTVRTLEVELLAEPYKGPAGTAGETRRYATELETATCGVQPERDAIYVLFGQARDGDSRRWVDTCSGSRMQISRSLEEPVGFEDVPARFVAQQLNGLAGTDVLRDVAANAPVRDEPANDALIGLLRLPRLETGGSVTLYTAPREDAVRADVEDFAGLATREYSYEQDGAVAVAEAAGWYRVPLVGEGVSGALDAAFAESAAASATGADSGFVWIPAAEAELLRYPDLVVGRLAYLNEHWSGFVWPEAGAGLPFRRSLDSSDERREQAVHVLEVTEIGGMPFLRVELVEGVCEVAEPRVVGAGWVPAYGRSGEPVAWFYSRGC